MILDTAAAQPHLQRLTLTFVDLSQRLSPAQLKPTGSNGKPRSNGEAAGGQAAGDVSRREELVIQQLVDCWARGRVGPQHLLDEVSSYGVDVLRGDRDKGQGTTCTSGCATWGKFCLEQSSCTAPNSV